MIGIYKFENLQNGHCYIGQSVNIEKRYKDHLARTKNSNSSEYNSYFHRALRKYGIENFSFIVLEGCAAADLNQREEYWIQHYNSYVDGYNETTGGDHQEATSWINEDIIYEVKKLLLNSQLTYEQIHHQVGISTGRISEINTGKYAFCENTNYPLRDNKQHWYCKFCGKEVSRGSECCIECANKKRRTAERPDRSELKTLIRTLPFTKIGEKYGVTGNAIKKWCDSYNLPRTKKAINQFNDIEWELI